MKRIIYTILAIMLAANVPAQETIELKIDSMLINDPLLETSQLGLMVYDLTTDTVLIQYNHRQTMRPASTMKLITAITALEYLGGNYQFNTTLSYSGNIENHTLTGNLYCVGGMDPMFDGSDLHDFVSKLRALGIDTIRGSIVTDRSMKDIANWGEGWCWDDDNPTLNPLLVAGRDNFVERLILQLTGEGVVIDSLSQYEDWKPLDAIPVATCRHSIDQVMLRMMKESDNLYAECVYYHLAVCYGRKPAQAIHARTLEKQLVKHLGLKSNNYSFADSREISLYNYVSPQLLTMLLRHAWKTPAIYQHLLPTLPIAGEDGTLKKRMNNTMAEGNVRAKTGTLTGIISLAGYCTAANGHELCFAIMNQGVLQAREARDFQDRLCMILCE
jgi:D-alanyl-D-alanine carboxypeptidase/D-alanyl-D-alanine-endopeptidase (penicillin-binding protein 4)